MKIGIDFDDCLINYFPELIVYLNKVFGTSYGRDDIFSFDLTQIWKVDPKQMIESILDFYSIEDQLEFAPVDGAVGAIEKLSQNNELIVITGRPNSTNSFVKKWLEKNMPGKIQKIIFTHQFHSNRREKFVICKEENVDIFIDDNLSNVLDAAKNGIKCFLIDGTWNQGDIPDNIKRVKKWEEIVGELENIN